MGTLGDMPVTGAGAGGAWKEWAPRWVSSAGTLETFLPTMDQHCEQCCLFHAGSLPGLVSTGA